MAERKNKAQKKNSSAADTSAPIDKPKSDRQDKPHTQGARLPKVGKNEVGDGKAKH